MAELSMSDRLRTAHVTRWQIVRTAREQTLAEHLYLVRIITLEMCGLAKFSVVDTAIAEQWALEHDVPEVVTGDLATPVKVAMREAVPHDDPIRRIELAMSDRYKELYHTVKVERPWIRLLVKMADTLEAVIFLAVEGMGVHAACVKRRLWQNFNDLVAEGQITFPSYDWPKVYDLARAHTGA